MKGKIYFIQLSGSVDKKELLEVHFSADLLPFIHGEWILISFVVSAD